MKKSTLAATFALLPLILASCQQMRPTSQRNNPNTQYPNTAQNQGATYDDYGYYTYDQPQQNTNTATNAPTNAPTNTGANPYQNNSYAGYQQTIPRDQEYVQVTPTAPQPQDASPQIASNGSSIPPLPSYDYPTQSTYPAPTASTAPAAAGQSYVVQLGDTLYRISKMHNSSVDAIKDINGLSSNLIHPGDVLSIP